MTGPVIERCAQDDNKLFAEKTTLDIAVVRASHSSAERYRDRNPGHVANHSAGVAFAGRCGGEVYVTGADVELRAVLEAGARPHLAG